MANWDDNDWESVSEENLRYFYEEYSASVRKQLLNKNLLVPQNVYDVLYPRTKEALLAKNVASVTDLEENSKTIRDALVAKLVSENIDLEKLSEDTRKSLLARNKIIQEANDLLNNSYSARQNILSKNRPSEGDLLKDSTSARQNNISKNHENLSLKDDFDANNEEFRINNLAKNSPSETNLSDSSIQYRENNQAKNAINSGSDLEKESQSFRDNNLSKNIDTNKEDLESTGEVQRFNNQIKNSPVDNTIDKTLENAEAYRNDNISKNVAQENTFDENSEAYRQKNLANNITTTSDLENDSESIRRKNQSANTTDSVDLLSDSNSFRDKNTSKNKEDVGDLAKDSEEIRAKNISANKAENGDLLGDSSTFRQNNLANNNGTTGDLETESEIFRQDNLSTNKSNDGDLLSDSTVFLKNNTSANKPIVGDLLNDSKDFLQNNTSANKPIEGDLLKDSEAFAKQNTSANKPDGGDLLDDSKGYLQNNTSSNKPSAGDLLKDSEGFLQSNTSANKPVDGDLLSDSEGYLQNNTSPNKPSTGDLLIDSQQFLDNNTSPNKPSTGDLLIDSEQFLDNNTAPNVPSTGDLLIDSQQFLNNNVAPNVPSNGDLLADSATYLNNNVAPNVPDSGDLLTDSAPYLNNNTIPNVPSTGDLLTDSSGFLHDNIVANIPNGNDLLADSAPIRNDLVAANVPHNVSLEAFSKPFRDHNLAANPPVDPLGTVIEGIGTATYLGVSRVLTQGLILRQILISRNKNSKYNIDNFVSSYSLEKTTSTITKDSLISKNQFQLGKTEYTSLSADLVKGAGSSFYGQTTRDMIKGQLNNAVFYNNSAALALQNKYGTSQIESVSPASIGGGFYSLDTVGPKGGFFDQANSVELVSFDVRYKKGSITDAIRNYNLSRNLYNLYKLTPGDLQSLTTLQQNNDEGFQDLLARTIGHLRGNDSIGSQLQGNLVPRGILVSNEGAYIKGGAPENMLRPQQAQGMAIGTPESMMAKTAIGNPLFDTEFQAGTKGVTHIIRTIRNSDASKFSINYDVQNSQKYIIGVNNDGSPKVARQRFTVSNPYKPGNAKTLLFYLQNYSSGQGFYFPPYIQSYSDSYGAGWNSVNFLGRPEPVFTYNNSTREGTISFVVLTDYTQNLIIGRDYSKDSLDDVKVNPKIHFTSKDAAQNKQKELANQQAEAKQKETNNAKKDLQQFNNIVSGGTPESNVLQQDINSLEKQANSIQKAQENSLVEANNKNVYSETNSVIGNVNNFMTTLPSREAGDVDTKAEDSKKRIDQMIQNLAFQPAFFSGDKVDFLTKMEFLAKLTRPAAADEGSGFSFTRPPVCHIHLGDWWNNDIVVDSVSFSYDDVPWTLDEGRVQPMWAVVNLNFKFIGPYRGQQGGPVLSDDKGGFYQLRT
jgi:hypothetical protein